MEQQQKKLWLLTVLIVLILTFLALRLFDLQVNRHEEYKAEAEDNTVRTIRRDPLRGQILDIRGTPLALSKPVKVICANPALLGPWRTNAAQAIAPLLGMTNETGSNSLAALLDRMAPIVRPDGKTNVYRVLQRKVSLENWKQIHAAMTNLSFGLDEKKLKTSEARVFKNIRRSGIFAEDDQVRIYPNYNLAAHVIGYVGILAKPTNAPAQTDDASKGTNRPASKASAVASDRVDMEIGLNGIELTFNSKLTGTPGWRRTEQDSRHREIMTFREQDVAPRNGLNVVLTLDSGIQNIVEKELANGTNRFQPISISCVVVRPKTGEILAMATLPTYNPNNPGTNGMDAMRNRVICDISEPGSTFKIVPISAALNERLVSLNTVFFCENGHFGYAGKTLHDDHGGFGNLTVAEIIMHSSNIGAAKNGLLLGEERLYNYIRRYNLGMRTGIPLPGEQGGIVYPPKKWSKVSIVQIPMGHGIAVTPLQTLMAMSSIANGGVLMKPMLIDRLVDEEGNIAAKYQPQVVGRVISEETAKQMVSALKLVVTAKGTAPAAALEHYTVAGKTGTAYKVEDGHYVHKYFSSFIGFLPADNPEICISVVLDEPRENSFYGGKTAGPVFHAIAEQAANYLNIKPDIEPDAEAGLGLPPAAPAAKPAPAKAPAAKPAR